MIWKTRSNLSARSRAISQCETKPRDQDGTESSEKIQNEEFAEYSPSAERRERIIKLRLANEAKRMVLEEVRRSTATIAEWVENMDRIQAALRNELFRLPASLCHELANREPQYIQQVLDATFPSTLGRLSRPETYPY